MDAVSFHLAPRVFKTSFDNRLRLGIIPSKLTWLVQVLDTHLLSLLKRDIKKHFHERRAVTSDGKLGIKDVVEITVAEIARVLQGRLWGPAFVANGFAEGAGVSKFLLRQLEWDEVPQLCSDVPSLADMKVIWHQRRTVPYATLFGDLVTSAHTPPAMQPGTSSSNGSRCELHRLPGGSAHIEMSTARRKPPSNAQIVLKARFGRFAKPVKERRVAHDMERNWDAILPGSVDSFICIGPMQLAEFYVRRDAVLVEPLCLRSFVVLWFLPRAPWTDRHRL